MEIEELKKYITLKKCDNKNYEICYVDFNHTTKDDTTFLNSNTKIKELEKIDLLEINKLILNKIIDLSNNHDDVILEKFTYNSEKFKYDTEERKVRQCMTRILNASEHINIEGKIGPATNMIISKENYYRFSIEDFSGMFDVIFEDVNDIYLYRKNSTEQTGLLLFYYKDEDNKYYYDVESVGFYPEKQYMKLKIN